MRRRMAFACAVLAMATVISGTSAQAANGGFKTSRPSMLTPVKNGVTVTPLLTVGDVFGDSGFRFEAIPDGISLRPAATGGSDLFVNHETSKVPFPFNTAHADRGQRGERLRQLAGQPADPEQELGRRAGRLLRDPEQRRLPAVLLQLPRDQQGGVRPRHPVHERGVPGLRVPAGGLVAAPMGDPAEEENGVVLALDVKTKQYHVIYGMGRHNHENNVAIPGFDDLVVLSGDDTFTSGPLTGVPAPPAGTPAISGPVDHSRSSTRTSRRTRTHCSPTRVTCGRSSPMTPTLGGNDFNDYYDFAPGSTDDVSGHFIQVPKTIATGKNADGSEVKAADFDYPLPPTNGSWQTRSAHHGPHRHRRTPVGARVLEPDQQRLRLRPRRGHRLRQATGHGQRRLHRRLGPGPSAHRYGGHTVPVDERTRLEDGARPERPDQGDVVLDRGRG